MGIFLVELLEIFLNARSKNPFFPVFLDDTNLTVYTYNVDLVNNIKLNSIPEDYSPSKYPAPIVEEIQQIPIIARF